MEENPLQLISNCCGAGDCESDDNVHNQFQSIYVCLHEYSQLKTELRKKDEKLKKLLKTDSLNVEDQSKNVISHVTLLKKRMEKIMYEMEFVEEEKNDAREVDEVDNIVNVSYKRDDDVHKSEDGEVVVKVDDDVDQREVAVEDGQKNEERESMKTTIQNEQFKSYKLEINQFSEQVLSREGKENTASSLLHPRSFTDDFDNASPHRNVDDMYLTPYPPVVDSDESNKKHYRRRLRSRVNE